MSLNVFTFSGNLGRDCRKGNASGTAVVNFAVACKSGYGQNEQTIWIDCALWGKQAESKLPDYLLKGRKVTVSGELGTREHEGKTYLTCRVNSIDLGADGANTSGQQGQQPQQPAPQQSYGTNVQQPNPQQSGQSGNDFDDDIPFAPIGKQYRSLLNCM